MTNEEEDIISFGKEVVENGKQFKIELDNIEKKNIDYFKSRPPHSHLHKHEIPMDNLQMTTSNGIVTMRFIESLNLPLYLKDEIIKAFKKVYPS